MSKENKVSDNFKSTIEKYIKAKALTDSEFAEKVDSDNKNIDDCIKYILNTVQKSGVNGFHDDEIFGMAIHYYDEEKIDVGKDINANVVINHQIQLTDEEKAEIKKEATERLIKEEMERKQNIGKKKTTVNVMPEVKEQSQQSLF